MKKVLIFCVLLFLFAIFTVVWSAYILNKNILEMSTFIVITLTLIALVIYAYDTNSMANILRSRWKQEGVLNVTYSMKIIDKNENENGRTLFGFTNPTSLVVKAKVWCNFQIYSDPVEYNDDFNGINTWYVFPQQYSQGWFEIGRLLEQKGKSIDNMIAEASPNNRDTQLTIDLKIEFRDERGESRELPSRKHYFAFKDWCWIPILTAKDDWENDS